MKISDFDYNLPKEKIAQYPLKEREGCKLMVIDRNKGKIFHTIFKEIKNFLFPGDLLILNDSKVIKAKIFGRRKTGAKVEIFLLKKIDDLRYKALLRPLRRLKDKEEIELEGGFSCIIEKKDEGIVKFNFKIEDFLNKHGKMPLPPYIKRSPLKEDEEYYQTVFGKRPGSLASHTAGLHFNEKLLAELKEKGVKIKFITLHMSIASFKILNEENLKKEDLPEEFYSIDEELVKILDTRDYKRLICCGTSVVRCLESYGLNKKREGFTQLFIKPGFKFKFTQALITNFHYPKSSHIILVASFLGLDLLKKAYKEALNKDYRFLSYGDAMLIL